MIACVANTTMPLLQVQVVEVDGADSIHINLNTVFSLYPKHFVPDRVNISKKLRGLLLLEHRHVVTSR